MEIYITSDRILSILLEATDSFLMETQVIREVMELAPVKDMECLDLAEDMVHFKIQDTTVLAHLATEVRMEVQGMVLDMEILTGALDTVLEEDFQH
ncbi:hypothetical protein BSG1_16265 [Bacillus sp. SG-1]|nr:hypothetical protein BSG1_16265 [Bacillus sp. SG-1]